MADASSALHWAAKHPIPVAVGVFAVGAILLLMMGGHGSSSSSSSSDMSAFYAAQAAQAADGASVATTQSNNATALGIAQIQGNTSTANTASNNAASVAMNQSNNNLSAYQTYKATRLATQQSDWAYFLDYNGAPGASDFASQISQVNQFGSGG